jgi:hypothetical protein
MDVLGSSSDYDHLKRTDSLQDCVMERVEQRTLAAGPP